MALPRLHGIVPPLATPLNLDDTLDERSLERLTSALINAGIHGGWILGTTARFDLITDSTARRAAEIVTQVNDGRIPLVLNVSDMSTGRTLERASRFDDLPFDYYAALPPWYLKFSPGELLAYFHALADSLSKPLVIYNAPWVCNELTFEQLQSLSEHPRIVGVKDVCPSLFRTQNWSQVERRSKNFTYLHGSDLIGTSTALGADGFVPAMGNAFPELCVALWDAARSGDDAKAFRLQNQLTRLGRCLELGPMLACLEAACRHRGFFNRMLASPAASLDELTTRRLIREIELVGVLPDHEPTISQASV